jgi:hypothetical protein
LYSTCGHEQTCNYFGVTNQCALFYFIFQGKKTNVQEARNHRADVINCLKSLFMLLNDLNLSLEGATSVQLTWMQNISMGYVSQWKEHLRTQKRLNLHTLFLCFWSSKNICSLPPSTSSMVKIAQIEKGIRKDAECLV